MRVNQAENQKINFLKMKNRKKVEVRSENRTDQISISKEALKTKGIKKKLAMVPELRSEKVNLLKSQVQNGTYKVDSRVLAKKILDGIKKG